MENENPDLVVKSNELIEALTDMTLQQQRLFGYIISQLPRQTEVPGHRPFELEVPVAKFANAYNISLKNAYREIERNQNTFQTKIIQLKENNARTKLAILVSSTYYDNEGRIKVEIHNKLLPYLFNLKERFTSYRIKDVYQFSSANTWRMYELMAQYKNAGTREMALAEIRWALGIVGKYERPSNLKQWVVEPAIKEINKVSDLSITYKTTKRGRKVVGFIFDIQKKERAESNGQVIDLKKKKTGKKVEKKTSLLSDVNLDKYRDKSIVSMTEEEQKDAIYTALKSAGVHDGPAKKIVNAVIEQGLDYKNVICETINCMRGQHSSILGTKPKFGTYVAGGLLKKFKLKE